MNFEGAIIGFMIFVALLTIFRVQRSLKELKQKVENANKEKPRSTRTLTIEELKRD